MDRGTWQIRVHGVTKSWTRLSGKHSYTLSSLKKKNYLSLDFLQFEYNMLGYHLFFSFIPLGVL